MERIYLVSAAGFPNYGDEFITLVWLKFLAKSHPEAQVWVDCLNPGHAQLLFSQVHPNVHFVNTLWQLIKDVNKKEKDPQRATNYISYLLKNDTETKEYLGIELLKTVDSLHFLGGGYVNTVWRDHYLLLQLASAFKKLNPDLRLFGTGLGLYPIDQHALPFVKKSLKTFDSLSVRDEASAKIAGIPLGYDDAFLGLGDEFFDDRPADSARVFISLQQDVIGRNEAAIPKIAEMLISSGVEPDEPIQIFEALPPDDNWSVERFTESWFGEVSLLPFYQIWDKGFPRISNGVWASSRFHMHLLAASQGMRGIGLVFDNRYYQNKHRSLFDLKTGWGEFHDKSGELVTAGINKEFPARATVIGEEKNREARTLYPS